MNLIPGGYIGVGIFFIISWYFNINKNKINLFSVIYSSLFYGFFTSIYGLYLINHYGVPIYDLTKQNLLYKYELQKFHPISTNMYWFISIYLFIISISHILNKFLRNLNKLGFTLFLLFYWNFLLYIFFWL